MVRSAQLDARAGHVAHGAVVARRHQEADAGLADGAFNQREIGIEIDAERRQHVGGAALRRQRPIAMLGHRHAAAGDDQRRAGRDVERAGAVAAGADDVDGVLAVRRRAAPAPASPGPRR